MDLMDQLREAREDRARAYGLLARLCGVLRIESTPDAVAAWCFAREQERKAAAASGDDGNRADHGRG